MIHGLDVGGTKIELAVFDPNLDVVHCERVPTPTNDYAAFVDTIEQMVDRADTLAGSIGAIGIGMPGLIDREGRSFSANIPGASGHRVAADLSRRLGRPVAMENDCRCFALSEAAGGAGESHRTVFGAILGTGAAGGLVIDGVLYRGYRGVVGEYGHIPLPAPLQQSYDLPLLSCGCGRSSCLDAYIAGPGLVRLGHHFGTDHPDAQALVAAWRGGDAAAAKTFECYFDLLGAAFVNIVIMNDPEVIVLGGGLSLIDEIVERLPGAIEQHLFKGFASPPVVRARFGDSSGARGAAILARHVMATREGAPT